MKLSPALSLALLVGGVLAAPEPDPQVRRIQANGNGKAKGHAKKVREYWTKERRKAAIPRDFTLEDGPPSKQSPSGLRDRQLKRCRISGEENAEWTAPTSRITRSAGRVYFTMDGSNYVCSGTVVDDGDSNDRSVILTAGHCVYDDAAKAFATFAMFIPQQQDTTGSSGTDRDCANDPEGCYVAAFGLVDEGWASKSWPSNIPDDYGYYVVDNDDDGSGNSKTLDAGVAGANIATVDFTASRSNPCSNGQGVLMGYSANCDPDFMYCRTSLGMDSDGWVFSNCGLSGGASGGPGMCGNVLGDGPLTSVVSWGSSGGTMGGPHLSGNMAQCLFNLAKDVDLALLEGKDGAVTDGCSGGKGTICTDTSQSWCPEINRGGPSPTPPPVVGPTPPPVDPPTPPPVVDPGPAVCSVGNRKSNRWCASRGCHPQCALTCCCEDNPGATGCPP